MSKGFVLLVMTPGKDHENYVFHTTNRTFIDL